MKYLTRLALAAAASSLLIAALGAGTATAGTTLCKANETPCGAENVLPAGAELEFRTKEFFITFTAGGEFCSEATFVASIANAGGKEKNVTGPLEKWNFPSCTCPTKVLKAGKFTLESTPETMNGKFSISEYEVEIKCGTSPRCVFKGSFEPSPMLKGGKPAVLAMEAATLPLWEGNGICRRISTWEGNWEVTNYPSLWVSNG